MKQHIIAVVISLIAASTLCTDAQACTTFSYSDGDDTFVGKAFDWSEDHGHVFINKRNVEKRGFRFRSSDRPPTWVSRFGSVTFNQHGREFPLGGINEAGLVIEIMVGDAQDIASDDPRYSLNEIQLIQYILDNYATAETQHFASRWRAVRVYVVTRVEDVVRVLPNPAPVAPKE